jgi:2-hydroxychromene-2-carboxylate isomerase
MPAPKRAHLGVDLGRWAEHWGVPFGFPPGFPMNTVKALRMVVQVPDEQKGALVRALFDGGWAHGRDLTKDPDLVAMATGAGFDGAALLAGASADAVKDQLRVATKEAEELGLFGAPHFIVNGLVFWGQDRLDFVERALGGWRPRGE